MNLDDFDFHLPNELIAQYPLLQRSSNKLMRCDVATGCFTHELFSALPTFVGCDDILVFNDTKVIPARLFATKTTGGRVEILVERILNARSFLAQARAGKTLMVGDRLMLSAEHHLAVTAKHDGFYEFVNDDAEHITELFELFGQIPLPPYIERQPTAVDAEYYQTVYAQRVGAVAAPTAGLHFDTALLDALAAKGVAMTTVTLHVGAGTFRPIREHDFTRHRMHAEYMEISAAACAQINAAKQRGGRVIAVGTTSVRSLETAASSGTLKPFAGDTDIFIYPGYKFRCVDAIITNFHTPKSTLLLLVSAFAGYDNIMRAYKEAVDRRYRFFSYGDAMLLERGCCN